MQLLRYSGAELVMILWMWRHNLNLIRWGIGSQWSSRRRGVVGVARPTLKTSRAARFWMDFSLLISFPRRSVNKLLQ